VGGKQKKKKIKGKKKVGIYVKLGGGVGNKLKRKKKL